MSVHSLFIHLRGLVLILLIVAKPLEASAADLKLEAILVWGTNEATSPNPKHKPVEPLLAVINCPLIVVR